MNSLSPKKIMNIGAVMMLVGILLPYLGGGSTGKDLSNIIMNLGLLAVIGGFLYHKFGKNPPQS